MGGDPPKYQVEDVLNKKKPPPQILDLKSATIETEEEFQKILEKIPDYKIKPEKPEETEQQIRRLEEAMKNYRRRKKQVYSEIKAENLRQKVAAGLTESAGPKDSDEDENSLQQCSHDRAHSGKIENNKKKKSKSKAEDSESNSVTSTRRSVAINSSRAAEYLYSTNSYSFADPCPPSMRHVRIEELSAVDINWKMLTMARPTTAVDENIFSKLVDLEKLRLSTRKEEKKVIADNGGLDPFIVVKNPSSSRGGVMEKIVKVCEECLEEFCGGSCLVYQYDSFQRLAKEEEEDLEDIQEQKDDKKRKKSKKKKKKKAT